MHSTPYNIERLDKFLAKAAAVSSSLAPDDCWIWPDATSARGYGRGSFGNGGMAHRCSFTIFDSDITECMSVAHLCGVAACFNPAHLVEASEAVNNWHKSAHTSEGLTHSDLISRFNRRLRDEKRKRENPIDLRPEEIERFWRNTQKNDTSDCIEWTGKTCREGKNSAFKYGKFYWRDWGKRSHHVSFYIHAGRWIEAGKEISHLCRNTLCVNFEHLSEVTRQEHIRYAAQQGWLSDGHLGQQNNRRLTDEAIRYIKTRYRDVPTIDGEELVTEVDKIFGIMVTPQTIYAIRRGIRGKRVDVEGFVPIDRRRRPALSDEEKARVIELSRMSIPQAQIAAELGCSQATVSGIIRRARKEL